jgi:hypothetical protein
MTRPTAVILLALLLPPAGCSHPGAAEATLSDVQIALVQAGDDGALYRLAQASFDIYNAERELLFTVDANSDEPSVTVTLNPGIHYVQLNDGWLLERSDDGGVTYVDEAAVLASLNPAGIRVVPNREVSVSFTFLVRRVTGDLAIGFGASEELRQLSGGVMQLQGTGDYAVYDGLAVTYQIYYQPAAQRTEIETDGSRIRVVESYTSALEIFDDAPGLFSAIARRFSGGALTFLLRARPDGAQEFELQYAGGRGLEVVELTFGVSQNALFELDAEGFPADGFFYADLSDFLLMDSGAEVLRGTMQSVRHFTD